MADLTLTRDDDGGRFSVRVGDVITLHLPENAAAGYRWSVVSIDETRVAVESQRYRSTSDAVGSAGVSVWTLRAKQPGAARVELKKARPWEAEATERFTADLIVAER